MLMKTARTDHSRVAREQQKAWLRRACDISGLTLTEIARRAGLNEGTLTTFMRKDKEGRTLRPENMLAIAEAVGLRPPGGAAPAAAPGALSEPEAAPYAVAPDDPLRPGLDLLLRDANHFPYQLNTNALLHEGFRPGDILIVDMSAEPREGRLVCAQFYARNDAERTETVFRFMRRRFLEAAGPYDPAREAREIMDPSVRIMGVVVSSYRRLV